MNPPPDPVANDVRLDLQRAARIGLEEVVYAAGKSVAQLSHILVTAQESGMRLFVTRLGAAPYEALSPALQGALDYCPVSSTARLGAARMPARPARVAVVAAGTSDVAVAREAERTLAYQGEACGWFADVGVAGLWRLLDQLEPIRTHPVVIVVAGMDAALPTVLGGLIGAVLIGVPTSVGYGVAQGGQAALHAMLASCAPGIAVVNIDNGYGAACAALRILHALDAGAAAPARAAPFSTAHSEVTR